MGHGPWVIGDASHVFTVLGTYTAREDALYTREYGTFIFIAVATRLATATYTDDHDK